MSGSAGARGYLLQAIITLLDALQRDSTWESLTLEPNSLSEKVDIAWFYPEGIVKVTQVKSSQNQINLKQVKQWAGDLEKSFQATSYELILIGPCSQSVIGVKKLGQVIIPTPQVLNANSLVEQAAHRLDLYIEQKRHPKVSASTRELLVNALVTKLESFSSTGTPISRQELDTLVRNWIRVTISGQPDGTNLKQGDITYRNWMDILVSYQLANTTNPLAAGFMRWLQEVQSAMKIINTGVQRFTQGGYITNAQIRQYYQDAKKLEDALENTPVPPISLQAHLAIRESARHYRRAVGKLREDNQHAFADELSIAKARTGEATKAIEEIAKKL